MQKLDSEKIIHAIMILIVSVFLQQALLLPRTAGFLPKITAIFTLLLLTISLAYSIIKGKSSVSKTPFFYGIFCKVFILIGVYVGSIYLFGVLLSSVVFIYLLMVVLESKNHLYNLAVTISFNLATYIVFNNLLKVPLLKGMINFF